MAELYIGLMSGTSMDGIDAVLVDLSERQPKLHNTSTYPWPTKLKERLQAVASGEPLTSSEFGELEAEVGEQFALAAKTISSDFDPTRIKAIGSHGQTIAHNPTAKFPYSLQIGDANRISEITGITTVADFRRRDIAAGGQGAPLLPAYHQALFRTSTENRLILNIGGIANLTWLAADATVPVIGFDTGPGNCLMDNWINKQQEQSFDKNGEWAASGSCIDELLTQLLLDNYFSLLPPKSTGTDYFSLNWLEEHLAQTAPIAAADVQATLLSLTAESIIATIQQLHPQTDRVLVCGGGAHNPQLMHALQQGLNIPVESTSSYGLSPDWVEAVGFAWLAQQTQAGQAGNLSSVTGATGPRVLGAIYPV